MSELFDTLTPDEWKEQGGVGNTERGLYPEVLKQFIASGERYAVISMARGRFSGKKAASVAQSLKTTRDGKNAEDGWSNVTVKSRAENEGKGVEGAVFLENTSLS